MKKMTFNNLKHKWLKIFLGTEIALAVLALLLPLTLKLLPTHAASGTALQFDGSQNYVDIGIKSNLDFTTGFTFDFWANYSPYTQGIFTKMSYPNGYFFYYDQGAMVLNINGTVFYLTGAIDNNWNHIIAKWTGTQIVLKLNNGTPVITDYNIQPASIGKPFYLGRADTCPFSAGKLDEFRIFNHATTDEEDAYSYNNGAGRYAPLSTDGLVGWWHLDEGTGTLAADSSTGGNDGTLTGSPLPTWVTGIVQLPSLSPTDIVNTYLGNVRSPNYPAAYNNYSTSAQAAFATESNFENNYLNGTYPGDPTQSGPKIKANTGDLANSSEQIQGNQAVVTGTLNFAQGSVSAKFLLVNEGQWKILTIQIPGTLQT